MIEASIKSSDLLYLSLSIYDNNCNRTVIIVEGINEYKERYKNVCEYFTKSNFNIVIYDSRGHGKSINDECKTGVINDANKLIEDLRNVVNYTVNRFPTSEIFILGDSLGATTAINYLQYNEKVKKVALISPIYHSNAEKNLKLASGMMSLMGKNNVSTYFQNLLGYGKESVLLNDGNELYKIRNDSQASFRYTNKSVCEIMRLEANINNIKLNNTDVLILTGSLDKTFSGKDNVKSLSHIMSKSLTNISYYDYPSMGHKLLFDYGCSLVYQDILGFFLA